MTTSDGGRADRDRLFILHQGLVRAIAWKTHRRVPRNVDVDDLVAYGQIGLLEAINAFDATLDRKFVTFAWHRIRGAILDGLGKMSWFERAGFERGAYEPRVGSTAKESAAAAPVITGGADASQTPSPANRARPARSDLDTATVAARERDTLEAVMAGEQ
ncbi:MAG: hypothetical protein FJ275_13025, partial [Planctomycetes bacterium]|nr:hypothetical protein [Planctomycetota bacterium]